MRRRFAMVAALLLAAGLMATRAWAQQSHVGTHAAYHFDVREPALGAQVTVPLMPQLELYPSGAYYMVDAGSLWAVNADLKYRLPVASYVGAGLNVARRNVNGNGDTHTGLNLVGGVEGRTGRIHPFMEGRVILNGESAFQLGGGINITLR